MVRWTSLIQPWASFEVLLFQQENSGQAIATIEDDASKALTQFEAFNIYDHIKYLARVRGDVTKDYMNGI